MRRSLVLLLVLCAARVEAVELVFADGIEDCSMVDDADDDRLIDCEETLRYQTNPAVADTDEDDLPDGDEVLGTAPPAGTPSLNLPALGADPRRKTILLEIDWADHTVAAGGAHSHRPLPSEVQEVVASFAGAPVPVPAGVKPGIQLIVDYGQGGAFTGGNVVAVPNGVIQGGFGEDYRNHKTANFAPNRRGYFHYMLSVHQYTYIDDSSGLGEVEGDDTIVALFCHAHANDNFPNTMMHELGHNLALHHGGRNEACNHKPNYNSVMNYKFQWPGVDTNCDPNGDFVTSFSDGTRVTLDENHLDENAGICGLGTKPLDWNGVLGLENDVAFNVNNYAEEAAECTGKLTVLPDRNDWADLELRVLPVPNPGAGGGAELSDFVACPAPMGLSQ